MTVPFDQPNSRIFWACQAVLVEERNTEAGNNGDPTGARYLTGIQSVGISSDNPSTSLLDVGRFQRKYTQYGQQTIEITISRVLNKGSDTFYKVLESQYTDYQQSHILHAENFGSKGAKDNNGKTLRNYDITILYTPDRFEQINAGNASSFDPDRNDVISVSYLNCLITNLSYSMSVDGVEESITLTTKNIKYNDDFASLSQYTLPSEWTTGLEVTEFENVFEGELRTGRNEISALSDPLKYQSESGNILKRQDFDLTKPGYGHSKLPEEVKRLFNFEPSASSKTGTNPYGEKQILGIQSINIDVSFDYTDLTDVGYWRGSEDGKEHQQNRWKTLNLPIAINCSFTGVLRKGMPYSEFLSGQSGDPEKRARNVDNIYTASRGDGSTGTAWQNAEEPIRIIASGIDKYFVWDMGKKNYLTSIEYTGGDSGGGNVEATISYSNQYSDLIITKTENDPLNLTSGETY